MGEDLCDYSIRAVNYTQHYLRLSHQFLFCFLLIVQDAADNDLSEEGDELDFDNDDDNDDDETLFECQDLIDWVSNSILMWGYQLILVIEKV